MRFQYLEFILIKYTVELCLQEDMSHLPQIVQTIAKTLLDTNSIINEVEDRKINDIQNSQKIFHQNFSLKEPQIDPLTLNECQEYKKQLISNLLNNQQDHANLYFFKHYTRKLKLLYPNFTQRQIQSATNVAWNKISSQEKKIYLRQNTQQQLSQSFSQNAKIFLQQKRSQIQISQKSQIFHTQQPYQIIADTQNLQQKPLTCQILPSSQSAVSSNNEQNYQSIEASTCAAVNQQGSQNLDKTQKYVLMEYSNLDYQEQKEGKITTFVVNLEDKQKLDQDMVKNIVIITNSQNQNIKVTQPLTQVDKQQTKEVQNNQLQVKQKSQQLSMEKMSNNNDRFNDNCH